MNRVFRIVWSTALNAWVVASELTGKHGKGRGCAASATIDERSSLTRTSSGAWTLRLGVLMGLASLYAAPTMAADKYWDVNGGSAGSGGVGVWDTTLANWNAAADGVAGPFTAWNNAALDNAIFAGTAGTVTLGGPITVNNVTFSVAGYTLTGGTLTLAGTTPTISGAATINSVIAGNAGLIKTVGGVLTLTGANTFSGGVTINGGQLSLASDAALGAASNGITMADGTQLNATSALAATRVVTLTSGNVGITGTGVGSVRFTGAGGLRIGSGVTLSNSASDYTGTTSFNSGGSYGFTSVGNLGQASSLGAPTTQANGIITVASGGGLNGSLYYSGDGDVSNRDWQFVNGGTSLINQGVVGNVLDLSGNMAIGGGTSTQAFSALNGDFILRGVISNSGTGEVFYTGTAGRNITVLGANTFGGPVGITNINLYASSLADGGTASSLGVGTVGNVNLSNGKLYYTGAWAPTPLPTTAWGRSPSPASAPSAPPARIRSRWAALTPAPIRNPPPSAATAAW
jgi:fibronectin-binding autotransporter adhesin